MANSEIYQYDDRDPGDEWDERYENLLDDDDWDKLCECGRDTCGSGCEECGVPLCPMCDEIGAGFCHHCPSDDYIPYTPSYQQNIKHERCWRDAVIFGWYRIKEKLVEFLSKKLISNKSDNMPF